MEVGLRVELVLDCLGFAKMITWKIHIGLQELWYPLAADVAKCNLNEELPRSSTLEVWDYCTVWSLGCKVRSLEFMCRTR